MQRPNEAPIRPRWIIFIVALAMFMETLDGSVLNTSLPQIAFSIGVSPIDLKVALTSYLLSLGILIPISGWMADRFGVRRIYQLAFSIFIVGSVGCGLSHSLFSLVLFRVIQGCGGAFMMPVGRLIVLRVFGSKELVRIMGFVVSMGLVGYTVGPLVGGFLTTFISWRWIFWLNIPVALMAIVLVGWILPKLRQPLDRPFDWLGFLFFGLGVGALLFVCDIVIEPHIFPWIKVSVLLGALVCLGLYVVHAKRVAFPMLDTRVLQCENFKWVLFGSMVARLAMGAMPFLAPLMLQTSYGWSAFDAGRLMIAPALGLICAKFFIPKLIQRFGFRRVILTNVILVAGLALALAGLTYWLEPVLAFIVLFCYGLVTSSFFSASNGLAFLNLPKTLHSAGSSIFSTMAQISVAFAIAISALGLMLQVGQVDASHHIAKQAFSLVFLGLAAFPLLSLMVLRKL